MLMSDDYFPNIINFVTSLSSVLSLELCLNTDQMIMYCSTIKFSRLTKCKILPCDSDWMDSLVPLLQNTPKLKFLTVDYRSTHQPPIASALWSTMSHHYYPECLYSSLEKFELIDYTGKEEEKELVEYILITAMCLNTVTISLRHGLPTQDTETMMDKLEAMSKLSITSQLLFKSSKP
ncbi:hypothetical protein BRARA_D02712 [Brassica rapa]|uniref:FBD domain-containing protein n=1 Tax=Brassica campestris TaxID=3711 RepID=A0A397ZPV0_BRACM|nr:hypothetical protein BRARA_D02712 [Brassica rapa]